MTVQSTSFSLRFVVPLLLLFLASCATVVEPPGDPYLPSSSLTPLATTVEVEDAPTVDVTATRELIASPLAVSEETGVTSGGEAAYPALVTPMPLSLPSLSPVAEWITYTHSSGVSLQYPAGWQVQVSSGEGQGSHPLVVFVYPTDPGTWSPRISLIIYDRSPEYRDVTDPYTWQPNEGGYEVYWAKTIIMAEAEGLEFIWVRQIGNMLEDGSLMAITYNEPHQLDIRLIMSLPDFTLREGEEEGWESVISEFGFFETMVKSIRIDRSP